MPVVNYGHPFTEDRRLIRLAAAPGRAVWLVVGSAPACFLLEDARAGGVLINTTRFDEGLMVALGRIATVRYLFFPSRLGAHDVALWRTACRARTLAHVAERCDIEGPIDEGIDGGVRLYGRLDFLPLAGRTRGTCALRSRLDPPLVFFGPALDHAPWPTLVPHEDDHSYENRLIGAVGLRGIAFDTAFCDNYRHGDSRSGPRADLAVARGVAALLDA